MNYTVILSPLALQQIDEYIDYIAEEQQAPLNASRMFERIWDAKDSLEMFPNRCPYAPENDIRDYEIRMRIVNSCLLLFTVDEQRRVVNVIGFRGGSQEPLDHTLPKEKH